MVPIVEVHIFTIHFEPPKRGQPLYKIQDVWSQGVHAAGSTVLPQMDIIFAVLYNVGGWPL